uniref:Integrase catalytic domain-containing protein n=1 Tax=Fagus sylvatica TaxID=28930 RepID=A0A2N9FNL1_FAGSY
MPSKDNVSWMSPIVRYLKEGRLPTDKMEARKLRIRASHFQLLDGILYKMGFSRPHLRCLSPEEANYVIREVHEGICGNHSGARALAHKLTRAGYYWPSLLHDAAQYVKTCDKCQRFANIPRAPPEEITPMTSPWPFSQWGLDIMGPFPVGTKQAKFLVVAIDYFTKWVEAEPLATITEKNVKNFVWKGVICRFGIPRVLVSDNGKQFDNGPFRDLCAQLNIKNHYSSPRHPQANGQVEVTNRTLLKQIKTRLEGAKGLWVEELPSILWAYRTTVRVPTGETPFKLTFGTEAVIPVEIGLTTLRTTFHKEEENEGQLRLNLDLLDETRDKAARRITLYQEKMAKYYNTKVKLRRFEIGDWVLRKITQATKDPSQGKLGPNWEGPYKVMQYYRRGTYHLEDRHGKKLPHPWNAEHLKKHPRGAKSRRESSKQMPLGGQSDTHEVQSPEGSHRNRCPSEDSQTPTRCKVQKGVIETDAPRRTVRHPRGAKSRRESSKQMPLGGQLDTHEVQSPEGSHRNRCPSEDS